MQYVTNNVSNNHWITAEIKIPCKQKTFLYILSKTTNRCKIKGHCTQYFSVLQKLIRKAKGMYYNELLSSSPIKSKTSWNTINIEIGTASSKKFTQTELNLVTKI